MKKVENWVFGGGFEVSKRSNFQIFEQFFFLENILFLIFFVETSLKSLSLFVIVSFVKSLKKKTWKNFPYKKYQSQFSKNRPIQNFETFFKNNLWIWSTCISIDVSFVPELKYGFKCHFGQIVLSQCPIMCIFRTISQYIS